MTHTKTHAIVQATQTGTTARTWYAGNLHNRPDTLTYDPEQHPDRWTITEIEYDDLPNLPAGARRLVAAAHTAGHVWVLRNTDVPPGTIRHGHPYPQIEVEVPTLDPRDVHACTRWSWADGRIDYGQYSNPPILLRDALALLAA